MSRPGQDTIEQVRRWREMEARRSWLPVLWRRVLAGVFAFASAGLAGVAYAWVTEPYAAELERLRSEASFSAIVQRRLQTMTPAELREYERLMRIPKAPDQVTEASRTPLGETPTLGDRTVTSVTVSRKR